MTVEHYQYFYARQNYCPSDVIFVSHYDWFRWHYFALLIVCGLCACNLSIQLSEKSFKYCQSFSLETAPSGHRDLNAYCCSLCLEEVYDCLLY